MRRARHDQPGSRRVRTPGTTAFTLIEVLVALAILAMMSLLIYGALDGLRRTSKAVATVDDRYSQGRLATTRMARELSMAFLSAHEPFAQVQVVRKTAFVGIADHPGGRVNFTSFSHRRLAHQSHESDQNELSYFLTRNPATGKQDLVRREAKHIDTDPAHGGTVQVMAEDVERFELRYYDPVSASWLDSWDSTQAAGQFLRLPSEVSIVLVLGNAIGSDSARFETKVSLPMQVPLSFASPQAAPRPTR
ncbi:MAG: prepilin-type N-terminal cleavage/methylation domain-containing protein [Polyangiaceae bacterium]|nr:prepilin-type N-terminal cleavage/methylation domain-containing protein [Polyangiaceae bacterium]